MTHPLDPVFLQAELLQACRTFMQKVKEDGNILRFKHRLMDAMISTLRELEFVQYE